MSGRLTADELGMLSACCECAEGKGIPVGKKHKRIAKSLVSKGFGMDHGKHLHGLHRDRRRPPHPCRSERDMTDLVERLREYASSWQSRAASKAIVDEAATELAALRERVKELEDDKVRFYSHNPYSEHNKVLQARAETAERKLAEAREALKPFAYYYDLNDCQDRADDDALEVPIRDLRRAAQVAEGDF